MDTKYNPLVSKAGSGGGGLWHLTLFFVAQLQLTGWGHMHAEGKHFLGTFEMDTVSYC